MNKAGEKVDVAGYEYELWSRAPQPGCWWATRDRDGETVVRVIQQRQGRWVIRSQFVTKRDLPVKPADAPTDPITHARATDPVTSKAAAKKSAVRAGTHKALLLMAYSCTTTGYTDREAAFVADLLSVGYWKRCSDLRNDGLIEPMRTPDGALLTRDNDEGVPNMVCSITDLGLATLAAMKEPHALQSVPVPADDDDVRHTCHPSGLYFDPKCEACCRERHPVSRTEPKPCLACRSTEHRTYDCQEQR
jgi:hypothetical protein